MQFVHFLPARSRNTWLPGVRESRKLIYYIVLTPHQVLEFVKYENRLIALNCTCHQPENLIHFTGKEEGILFMTLVSLYNMIAA